MINIATIEKALFQEILDGMKTTEYRKRKRTDSRLEKVRPGELLYLCEKDSERVAECKITGIHITEYLEYIEYAVHFQFKKLLMLSIRRPLGWIRQTGEETNSPFK